ncbi:MAG: hypothetical protein QXT25_01980 [Candidatus Anstonellaceae archaeon]
MTKVLFLLAAVMLLAGCTLFAEEKREMPPPSPQPSIIQPKNEENETNQTSEEVEPKKNRTVVKPVERPDPFASFPPRNLSDRIDDGMFKVHDMPGAPLNIYVIDAEWGDAVLINKGQFYMLVDAGHPKVVDFLKDMKVEKVHALVLSRKAPQSVGGAERLLEEIEVEEIWENNVQYSQSSVALVQEDNTYEKVLENAKANGITIKHPQAGDRLAVSGMEILVLNPQPQRFKGNPDVDSIVLKVSFNNFCILILHPTIQEIENALMKAGDELSCPVITYFKHGEARPRPPLLLEKNQVQQVIISAGKDSPSLPSPATLELLRLKGIKVWRTDKDGTIRIYADGYSPYEVGKAG